MTEFSSSEYKLIIESLFRITDKWGNDVDFLLNPEQCEFMANRTGHDLIPKARQIGFTTLIAGLFLAKCLSERNRRCVIISHEASATQRILSRIHYMIEHIKCPKPELKYSNRNEITFPKTDSAIYIGTAGAGNFGHGDTITDLHCSEISRWPDPGAILKGLFQAAQAGEITIESTGNGMNDYYHRACMRAAKGIGKYRLHFFNWLQRPEYTRPFGSEEEREEFLVNLDPELEEPEYLARGLTAEQLKWRRDQIIEMDYDLNGFKEQYPISLDECFRASGTGFFNRVHYIPTGLWREKERHFWVLGDHPKPGLQYTIGGDVGAGVGQDNSVLEVLQTDTAEQVGEWVWDRKEPDEFAEVCARVGRFFNGAYINIERNNHGILTLKLLVGSPERPGLYPRHLIHKGKATKGVSAEYGRLSDYGTFTSVTIRNMMIANARMLLATDGVIHSELLKSELDTFKEQDNGRIEADSGAHDDAVMAYMLAAFVLPRAAKMTRPRPEAQKRVDDFLHMGTIIRECEGRYALKIPEPANDGDWW